MNRPPSCVGKRREKTKQKRGKEINRHWVNVTETLITRYIQVHTELFLSISGQYQPKVMGHIFIVVGWKKNSLPHTPCYLPTDNGEAFIKRLLLFTCTFSCPVDYLMPQPVYYRAVGATKSYTPTTITLPSYGVAPTSASHTPVREKWGEGEEDMNFNEYNRNSNHFPLQIKFGCWDGIVISMPRRGRLSTTPLSSWDSERIVWCCLGIKTVRRCLSELTIYNIAISVLSLLINSIQRLLFSPSTNVIQEI